MSSKREIRSIFRESVFKRDRFRCVICGRADKSNTNTFLDAHHITPREEFPNGGYVKENGISLCDPGKTGGDWTTGCHYQAEMVLKGMKLPNWENFTPEILYQKIKSSKEAAVKADLRNI